MKLRLLPRSAANRIAWVAFVAYAFAMVALGGAVFFATHSAFSRQIDATIEQVSHSLQREYADDGIRGVVEAMNQTRRPGPISLGTALFDAAGMRLAGNLHTTFAPPGWHKILFDDPLEGSDSARAKITQLPDGYRLVVAADLESLEAIDRTILAMFALALGALLLLGLGGSFLLARYLKHRLAGIETTAAAIIGGDLAQRALVGPSGDEFDRVALSLNAMLDRIAGLIANLRQVSGDLAHDLRTPLSRLRNQLERLRGASGETERANMVERAISQSDDVLALFDAILRISEVEEGSLKRAFSHVDLSELATELGETLAPLAEDLGRNLTVNVEPGLRVYGDRELLAQAVINLVENAFRHTSREALIRLEARRDGNRVVLSVADNGPGIPQGERERVQQRFVRLDAARGTSGHGLGLSLVRAIASAHGAILSLGDAEPGLIATIEFAERIEP